MAGKMAWLSRSNVKVMLTVFFDHEGVVHHQYEENGRN
jgi:hypothetical protein